jgi:hypothetical protein
VVSGLWVQADSSGAHASAANVIFLEDPFISSCLLHDVSKRIICGKNEEDFNCLGSVGQEKWNPVFRPAARPK